MQLSFLAQSELYLVVIENKKTRCTRQYIFIFNLLLCTSTHATWAYLNEAIPWASIARITLSRLPRQKRFEVIGICLHPILGIFNYLRVPSSSEYNSSYISTLTFHKRFITYGRPSRHRTSTLSFAKTKYSSNWVNGGMRLHPVDQCKCR